MTNGAHETSGKGMIFLTPHKEGVVLNIHVQPKSAKNMICGIHGDALKLKITGPPVDGAANKQCLIFLSKVLNLPRSRMAIITGQKNRQKRVLIHRAHCQSDPDLQLTIAKTLIALLRKIT